MPFFREQKTFLQADDCLVIDIAAGDKITAAHVRSIRPGFGLAPKYYDDVVGKLALCDAPYGTPVTWQLVRKSAC